MYTYFSLRSLAKSNSSIDRALLKYGFSNFRLEILEYCELKDVLKREQHYLDISKPQYNIATIAVRKKIKNIPAEQGSAATQ